MILYFILSLLFLFVSYVAYVYIKTYCVTSYEIVDETLYEKNFTMPLDAMEKRGIVKKHENKNFSLAFMVYRSMQILALLSLIFFVYQCVNHL